MRLPRRIKSVQDIVPESDRENRNDIKWLCQRLHELRKQADHTLDDADLIDRLRSKLVADRDAVAEAKELWLEKSERKLTWLNLRKLTNDDPSWGHFESAIQLLDNHEGLPFALFEPISGCVGDYPIATVGPYFEKARIGRLFTVYKLLMMYGVFVVAHYDKEQRRVGSDVSDGESSDEEENDILNGLRERLFDDVLENTQFIYPIQVPPVLHDRLSQCWLYHRFETGSLVLIPNSGYVFGGEVQAQAPYNRGLDCTSFTGWITGCGRPLTYLYEIAAKMKQGEPQVINPDDKDMIKILSARHDVVEPRGSEMRQGDILVWRHIQGGGHAMLVQQVVDDRSILTVECTNYKDGHYEGYQERVVPILNPNDGGRTVVLRPLNQHTYDTYKERNAYHCLLEAHEI